MLAHAVQGWADVVASDAEVPLLGRATELGRVLDGLRRAGDGAGGALFLAGDPGIGKTRLAMEALTLARRRGFVTLRGAAYPLQADLGYAPVMEAFGPFLAGLTPAHLATLVRGLPDLGRMFSGLHLPPPAPLGDAALERTRLFEAVSRLVERIAAEQPVVLLIDDLHWADASSLELLHYLARSTGTRRVLFIAVYRVDEARTRPALLDMVRSLQRLGLAEELVVGGLGREPVAALARAVLGGEPPPELLAALHTRAAGTPLFVTVLIRGLRDTGALFPSGGRWILGGGSMPAVPPVLRDLMLARLERLATADRTLLELVVVAGNAASLAVLARVGGQPGDELEAGLRRLATSGLVVEEPAGADLAYRTGHPLIAEVAYGELPTIFRRRLHARVAQALEDLGQLDEQRLAHHYLGAAAEADPVRALDVLVAAAARAEVLHADPETAEYLSAALALARVDRPVMVGELLERMGHARSRSGQPDAAVAAWSEAAGGRERTGDRPATARLRGLLALAEWDRGRFDAAEAHLAAGLAVLEGTTEGTEAQAELIDLHYIRLRLLMRQADLAGLEEQAATLLSLAGRAGFRSAKAAVAAHLAQADGAVMRGRLTVAAEHGLKALDVAERADLPAVAAVAHRFLAVTYINAGDRIRASQHLLGELGLVRQIGSPILEATATFVHLMLDVCTDAWDGVLASADQMLAAGHRIGSPRAVAGALAGRAYVLALRGDLQDADRSVAEARDVYPAGAATDRHLFSVVEVAAAAVALAAGEPDRAQASATAAVATLTTLPCLGLSILGESQVAVGDPAGALDTARRLVDLGPDAPWPTACGRRVEGLALAAAGESAAAVDRLKQAAIGLDALGLPFQAARAWLDRAEVAAGVRPGGDGTPAVPSDGWSDVTATVRQALTSFDRLDARPFADRARRLLRAAGERPRARPGPPTGELSARELEVVRLVADGLSNTEIAGRLFISQRTVTTHLQHVYRRLGLPSRTALTRWALERGLVAPDT